MTTPRFVHFSDRNRYSEPPPEPEPFSERLRLLIGDQSNSAFARKVGLSESLIRKYLKGSEPSLSKAWQIARLTGASLYWLAGAPDPDAPGSDD